MLNILENNKLKLSASSNGGELHSIFNKVTNTEYLWNGDPTFWKYHAPILFPIIGKVKDNTYYVDKKAYTLPQHGLARTSAFKLIESTNNKLSYSLEYSKDTLEVYPFKFILVISYELCDNTLKISYKVTNVDDKPIYFSIGAHPAFMCPLKDNESLDDYYFEFEKVETNTLMDLSPTTGLYSKNRLPNPCNAKVLNLSNDLFKDDALVFDNLNSNSISLKSKKSNSCLSMNFEGFTHLGLWSIPSGCPFVCIEPWFGHADFEDSTGDFKSKVGIQSLDIGKEFNCSYTLTII